jgi:hypothetical protein
LSRESADVAVVAFPLSAPVKLGALNATFDAMLLAAHVSVGVPVSALAIVPPARRARFVNVCVAVHVFAWPRARDAITAPVVGETVNVPSELLVDETPPLLPFAAAVTLPSAATVIFAFV